MYYDNEAQPIADEPSTALKKFVGSFRALPIPDTIRRVCDAHEDLRAKEKGEVVLFDSGICNSGVNRSLQF